MTKEEMVILGGQASGLLSNPAFTKAVEQLRANLADRFFASNPGESEERERLFNLRLCLDAVIGNLQSFVLTAQHIENTQQETD